MLENVVMESRILFSIASRSRPDKCSRVIDNIIELCDSDKYNIHRIIDLDDPMFNTYLSNPKTKPSPHPCCLVTSCGKSISKIDAINRMPANELNWDIVVDISDDFVITKKGFDNIIREHCGPDDYLHFPEPFAESQVIKGKNESIVIMYCAGRDYYNRTGWIYNPVYKSLCADNEGTAVARKLGRYKFVDEQIFYHAHPAAGYGKADAQTKYTESFWKEDHKTYNQRKELNFPL